MVKKIFDAGTIHLVISILFALSAIFKTVSADPLIIDILWICAIAFALLGLVRSKRKRDERAG